MRRCCIPGCRSNFSKPYVSVFVFPKNLEICKLWLKNIGKPGMKVTDNIGVCIKHFEKHLILGIKSSDGRKKVAIKKGAVPTIFEDLHTSDDDAKSKVKKQLQDKFSCMSNKNAKSPRSSTSDNETSSSPGKSEKKNKKVKKSKNSPTTDQPLITSVKSRDLEDEVPINVDDDSNSNSNSVSEESNSKNDTFSIPSPYKNLPTVSVCLKEEDRVPLSTTLNRAFKAIKRSPSTDSKSSNGSTDVQKTPAPKRRKVEKPAPVVIGRQNDCYCWVCHRENIVLCCIACPRAYHLKCAGEVTGVSSDWVCPECQRILAAENVDTRSSTLADISLDRLAALLKLSLNKMKQRAPIAFHQPVSLEHYPLYLHYVIHPMDFSLIEKNIKQQVYGCTEAFLADVKWIAHNSCVFNGTQHPLSTNAKNLVKSCDQDMQEIEVCPDCFVHSIVRNKYWFSEACRKPHPLVWAKLKGFPYWPAKVVRIVDGNVDARFFGAHDRAWVPVTQCYHLSKEMPTSSKPKKKGNYEIALDELNVHVHLLIQKFGNFEYAPCRTHFDPTNQYLMYHGIDITKAAKNDVTFDASIASPSKMRFPSPEKDPGFKKVMETESEQDNSEETQNADKKSDSTPKLSQFSDKVSLINKLLKDIESDKSPEEMQNSNETQEIESNVNANKVANSEIKNSESLENSSNEKTLNNTESDQLHQLKKLELALERIKGYVSVNLDSEKENEKNNETEEKKEENKNNSTPKAYTLEQNKDDKILSPFIKNDIKLPDIEPEVLETNENVNITLEAAKKTDSFFLKLNETIESCKAKLGISEITDDISSDNDSVGDENRSRSDDEEYDNEENSSASDEESSSQSEDEENSSVNEDVDDENELSFDENEAENNKNTDKNEDCSVKKILDKKENGECTDLESDENSSSGQSNTDVEASSNSESNKNLKKSGDAKINPDYEDSLKNLYSDNPDTSDSEINTFEKNVNKSPNTELSQESNLNFNTNSNSSNNEHNLKEVEQCTQSKNNVSETVKNNPLNANPEKDKSPNVNSFTDQNNIVSNNTEVQKSPSKIENSSPPKLKETINEQPQTEEPEKSKSEEIASVSSAFKPDEEDDDIYICSTPVKKSPPIIVLDDDEDDNSVSDTHAIRSPPYSTSADSISNDESAFKQNNNPDSPNEKSVIINGNIKETLTDDSKPELMKKITFSDIQFSDIPNGHDCAKNIRKRGLNSANSDDDIQILQPSKRTGAIRTFSKQNAVSNFNQTPTKANFNQTPPKTPEIENRNCINVNPEIGNSPNTNKIDDTLNVRESLCQFLRNPVLDPSQLNDKDKLILHLKTKLKCVVTAYRIQAWKSSQEKEELRHNMNLVMMEMRQCFESDKKQAIEALNKKFEQEKQQLMEETKKKQWCASCFKESRYSCCWNTSYCSLICQKRHFTEHRKTCYKVKKKANSEMPEIKQNSNIVTSDGIETNKILILNVKQDTLIPSANLSSPINTQQTSQNKPQIQVLSPKPQVKLSSVSNSQGQPVQLYVAQEKSQILPTATSSTITSNVVNKDMDASAIITGVRTKTCDLNTAITLLKKKNLESFSLLKKNDDIQQEKKEVIIPIPKKEEKKTDEKNLEDRYFPSPPPVTFEDYELTFEENDSVSPELNLVIEEPLQDDKINPEEMEMDSNSEHLDNVNPEPDIVISDSDELDGEMVNIGHCTEVKATVLNKVLTYGITATKLTRCLVDSIFTNKKLLASCSAFGQKSNVTNLTRCALPARKVQAIIEFVSRRFPGTSKTEIVNAINVKCREARFAINKQEENSKKKYFIFSTAPKLSGNDKESETAATTSVSVSLPSSPVVITTSTSPKISPNLVCVQTSNNSPVSATSSLISLPKKSVTSPNILKYAPLLIRPNPSLNTVGTTAYIKAPALPVKRQTVRELLASKTSWQMRNITSDTKVVMSLDTQKTSALNTQKPVTTTSNTSSSRPVIIIGSQVNSLRTTNTLSPVQRPALPATLPITK